MIPSHIREKLEEMAKRHASIQCEESQDDAHYYVIGYVDGAEAAWSLAYPKVDEAQEEKDAKEHAADLLGASAIIDGKHEEEFVRAFVSFLAGRRSCPCRRKEEK